MNLLLKALAGAVVSVASMSAHAIAYELTNLGSVSFSAPFFDINNAGQISGNPLMARDRPEAAVWSNGVWTSLSPGAGGLAGGLNDHGHVVGSIAGVATLWKDGVAQTLPRLNDLRSAAYDINNAGQIVGNGEVFGGARNWFRPVLWSNGAAAYLPAVGGWATDINEQGQIVGSILPGDGPGYRAAIWRNGKLTRLGVDEGPSDANAINNFGVVAGTGKNPAGSGARFWFGNPDAYLGEQYSAFHDINDAGVAVGVASFDSYPSRAMIWRNGQLLDLNELVVSGKDGLGLLQIASAINEQGQIVGYAATLTGDGYRGFLLTPVPEPEHWAMLLVGLGLVGFSARRKT